MILKQKLLNQQKPPTNFTNYFAQFYMMNDKLMSIVLGKTTFETSKHKCNMFIVVTKQ